MPGSRRLVHLAAVLRDPVRRGENGPKGTAGAPPGRAVVISSSPKGRPLARKVAGTSAPGLGLILTQLGAGPQPRGDAVRLRPGRPGPIPHLGADRAAGRLDPFDVDGGAAPDHADEADHPVRVDRGGRVEPGLAGQGGRGESGPPHRGPAWPATYPWLVFAWKAVPNKPVGRRPFDIGGGAGDLRE